MAEVAAGVAASALAPLDSRVRDRIVRIYKEYYNEDQVKHAVLDVLAQIQDDTKTLRQVDFKTARDLSILWQEQPIEYIASHSSIKDLELIKFHASRAINSVSDPMDKLIAIGSLIHATYHYTILTSTETVEEATGRDDSDERNERNAPVLTTTITSASCWLEAKSRAQRLLRHYLRNFGALETAAKEELKRGLLGRVGFRDVLKRRKLLIQVLRLGHSVYVLHPRTPCNDQHPRFPLLEEAARKVAKNRHVSMWAPALPVIEEPYCYGTLRGHGSGVECCAVVDHQGHRLIVSGGSDGNVKVWDLGSGESLHNLVGHNGPVSCCAIFDEGRQLVSSGGKTLCVWDLGTGERTRTLTGHIDWVRCFALFLHKGHQQLLSGSHLLLKVWDLEDEAGQCIRTLTGPTSWVLCCAVFDEGRQFVAGCSDGTLQLCNLDTGECALTLIGHTDDVWSCTILEDEGHRGVVVSASGDQTLKVWELSSGQCLRTLNSGQAGRPLNFFTTILSSIVEEKEQEQRNRSSLIISGSETLEIWDPIAGECKRSLKTGHSNSVTFCVVFDGGRQLVTASADKTLRLFYIGNCFRGTQGPK